MLKGALKAAGLAGARRLSRHPLAVRVSIGLRNLAQVVVASSLADGLDPAHNGERRLIDAYGPRCRVIVDVGANVGDWSAEILDRAGPDARALLFEPAHAALARLQARFAGDSRVQVVPAAVADSSGCTTFYEEPAAGEESSLVFREAPENAIAREVAVTTLDEALAAHGVGHVDLLKIDAEGYDLHVLRGAARLLAAQAIAVVQFEYNRPWMFEHSTLGEALALLRRHGYEVSLLKHDGLHPIDYERSREYFAYSNFVAASPHGRAGLAGLPRGDSAP